MMIEAKEAQTDKVIRELDIRVRARVPVIAVITHEEQRFLKLLADMRTSSPFHENKKLYIWSRVSGLCEIHAGEVLPTADAFTPESVLSLIADNPTPAFYVLADFVTYLEAYPPDGPMLIRQLKELAFTLRSRKVNVFLVAPDFTVPPSLEKEVSIIDLALPDRQDIETRLDDRIASMAEAGHMVDLSDSDHDALVGALSGLTENESETALAIAVTTNRALDHRAIPLVLEQKKEAIRQSGSLTFVPPEPLDYFGGYPGLIDLILAAASTFTPAAKEFGIEPHKGFLLIGPPGCGKDYLKRIISGLVNRALLDMDMGAVMGEGGGIVGQAAMSIRRALKIATALEPVLGLSEFEKAVGGLASSNKSDGGETARTIGMLLNWMAEQDSCMVVATANDVRQLAPEQIREGRFGAKVWVGLPSYTDREAIIGAHLRKRKRNPDDFNLPILSEQTERFSGAEIEQGVKNALLYAFNDGARRVTDADLEHGFHAITPTGIVNRKEIDDLQSWAEQMLGAVNASGGTNTIDALTAQHASSFTGGRPLEV
ncbi:MAG: AAA family ATPase [Acidobacteria bacterium]|nr:AAA family ATPase [Acidobacteriota bacterium]